MKQNSIIQHVRLGIFVGALTLMCCASQLYGQDTEYSDPLTQNDLKEWQEAYVPPAYGVIGYGNLALTGKLAEGASYQNSTRAGLMVYYDAWQAAFEMRPDATYVRLMPRTVGRDGYIAAVIEYGWATASGEVQDYYSGTTPVTIDETRTGMGISVRTGSSENIGARFLFDATVGLINRERKSLDVSTSESGNFYYNLLIGLLARAPLGSVVVDAGPYLELGTGMLTQAGTPTSIYPEESYFRLGLQVAVALNLNRPSYLSGAQ